MKLVGILLLTLETIETAMNEREKKMEERVDFQSNCVVNEKTLHNNNIR